MKKIQTLLSGLAFLVTAAVVTAHAEDAAAETNAGLAKLLDFRVAIALFVVVGICLLVSLVIWRMPRSKAKGEKDSEGQEVSDKDLEALRISYGFWLVVGALLITLLVLVITLSALAPAAPKTTDIVAIIGAVTGVIGTLTAAFFGIQAAGAGRSQALTTLDNTLKNQAAVSAPTPTKLDPSYGPHAGSTRVSITGNGFTGASGVNFGVTPGTNFEFVNDGLVRASSPAAGDGGDEAKVMLIFPGATPQNRAAGTFYYYTIEPHHGVGGQPVTISGSGLKDDDDPRDPGGRTSRGITQNEWNNWRASHPGLPADVWQAPQEQVEAIYRLNYWNALACDQLPAGNQGQGDAGRETVGFRRWPSQGGSATGVDGSVSAGAVGAPIMAVACLRTCARYPAP